MLLSPTFSSFFFFTGGGGSVGVHCLDAAKEQHCFRDDMHIRHDNF